MITSQTEEIKLATGETVRIVYTRRGQQDPSQSDQFVVDIQIGLPCAATSLVPTLCYGSRVHVCGEALRGYFGKPSADAQFRVVETTAVATTWIKAFARARDVARWVLTSLVEACIVRKTAQDHAEDIE